MSETERLLVVMTTVSSVEQGLRLARSLVEEGRVACAQVLPQITSLYRWQGQIEQEGEQLLLLKLPASRYPQLEARLAQIHPYEEPEVIALEAAAVSQTYLSWALQQTPP